MTINCLKGMRFCNLQCANNDKLFVKQLTAKGVALYCLFGRNVYIIAKQSKWRDGWSDK